MSSGLRVGLGYDVHQLVEGRPLVLGGVTIAYAKGLAGHSDADVLLHAIIDALLGATALGDIGAHFPDTEDAWRDADSYELLCAVVEIVTAAGWKVVNVDSTVSAQAPRLKEHIPLMRARIAEGIGIDLDRISIKATTTERLGFVGRQEGLEARAICLVEPR